VANLGIAWFNVRNNPGRALECYEKAFQAEPSDARLLYELDQLQKRMGTPPAERLSKLERHRDLVDRRDDLVSNSSPYATKHAEAGKLWKSSVPGDSTHGRAGRSGVRPIRRSASPDREGIAGGWRTTRGLGTLQSGAHISQESWRGQASACSGNTPRLLRCLALDSLGRAEKRTRGGKKASEAQTGFKDMATTGLLRSGMLTRIGSGLGVGGTPGFRVAPTRCGSQNRLFATSLPNFLLFDDDLQKRNRTECLFLRGLAKLGLQRMEESAADFREALTLDVNHMWAQAELERL